MNSGIDNNADSPEISEIDSLLFSVKDVEETPSNNKKLGFLLQDKLMREEKRIDTYHKVVHMMAFIIIFPYMFYLGISIVYGFKIPSELHTMVSVIIGFYFARSLFRDT